MPIYEYQCGDCNQKFELFVPQRMSTEGVICRQCHGTSIRKLVSSFASVGAGDGGGDFSDFGASAEAPSMGGGCGCGGNCACGGH